MTMFRQNFLTKEWVIMAPERKARPHDFEFKEEKGEAPEYSPRCPFCPGNHSEKHEEAIFEIREGSNWVLRVVKNRYGLLSPEIKAERSKENFNLKVKGYGFAEVVIESPYHNKNFSNYTMPEVKNILIAYRERYDKLSAHCPEIDLVLIFRNHGRLAGTSLIHPHSQIIATPIVPLSLRTSLLGARTFCDEEGICPFCQLIKEEKSKKTRIAYENSSFIALCPFASKVPYEVWILPKRHSAKFEFREIELEDLADVLLKVLSSLHKIFGDFSYNYLIKSAPVEDYNVEYFHWHIDILPRLVTHAGFEMGSDIYVNPVLPEEASRKIYFNASSR
jgi:UDPglucose--hexose-1-phosphate uridylyltransferase